MIRPLAIAIPFTALVACTQSPPSTTGAVAQLAKACAVDEITAAAALDPGMSLPEVADDSHSAECDPTTLGTACCDSATPCTPMDYPIEVCGTLTAPPDAAVIAKIGEFTYTSDTTTQYYDTCMDPPDDPKCDDTGSAFVLQPYPTTRYAVSFTTDAATAVTTGSLYYIPEGSSAVRSEDGEELFPLLDEGEGYANPDRPVETPDGTKYVDDQNDCIPREDGCGFTCATC